MNVTLMRTLVCAAFATLTLSIPVASSMGSNVQGPPTGPAIGTTPAWHRPPPNCGTRHRPCPTGAVGGTNKWTCKPNGQGCHRQY
jgi:hypothetical protein